MKRKLTTSNVLATMAVVAALAGTTMMTAYAATIVPKFTGKHVVNGSLTSVDVKDRTLGTTAFSTTTRTQLKAKTGPKGDTGAPGASGAKGFRGTTGTRGIDAARAYSYITAEDTSSYITPKSGNMINPSVLYPCNGATTLPDHLGTRRNCIGSIFPHWMYDCNAPSGFPRYCGRGNSQGSAGSGATTLRTDANGVIGFTGDANGSFVSLMGPGNILITATLNFLKPRDEFHTRISCQPQVRRSNSSDAYTDLGVPTVVSSGEAHELVHLTVTGGTYFAQAGDYDFQVACRQLDEYDLNSSIDDWVFVSGNASATTTEM